MKKLQHHEPGCLLNSSYKHWEDTCTCGGVSLPDLDKPFVQTPSQSTDDLVERLRNDFEKWCAENCSPDGSSSDFYWRLYQAGAQTVFSARADTIERLQRELADKNESGWLIERGDSDPAAPKYWAAGQREAERSSAWTSNHMEAIRLARREDAEKVAKRLFPSIAVRIAEHGWTTGWRCMKGRAQLSIACNCAVCQDLAPLDSIDAARSEVKQK